MPNSSGCIHTWPQECKHIADTLQALGIEARPNTNGKLPYPYKYVHLARAVSFSICYVLFTATLHIDMFSALCLGDIRLSSKTGIGEGETILFIVSFSCVVGIYVCVFVSVCGEVSILGAVILVSEVAHVIEICIYSVALILSISYDGSVRICFCVFI